MTYRKGLEGTAYVVVVRLTYDDLPLAIFASKLEAEAYAEMNPQPPWHLIERFGTHLSSAVEFCGYEVVPFHDGFPVSLEAESMMEPQ